MMNFSDETVEKVAKAYSGAPFPSKQAITRTKAALSSLTLADLMQVVEVRAIHDALTKIAEDGGGYEQAWAIEALNQLEAK